MAHVFISYRHEDRDHAYVVNGHIRSIPLDTFLDDDQLRAGDQWREEIEHALDVASALVVLCTSKAMNSTEVLFEVSYALGRGIPVIPLRWERECQLPPFLAKRQYLDFSEGSKPWHMLSDLLRSSVHTTRSVAEKARQSGLVDIGRGRATHERTSNFLDVLSGAKRDSAVVMAGRSLTDWASYWEELETAIRERHLHVKLALLDVNAVVQSPKDHTYRSWIETPITKDWAIRDVPASMERLRRIVVEPGTGSLAIYGLPFFLSHSFIAFTKESDGHRYCLQEAGMAADKEHRPYLVLLADERTSYGGILEWMNESVMTEGRLLLYRDGTSQVKEIDTTHYGKIIASKVQRLGLVDLAPARHEREWLQGDVTDLINRTPDGGEIFIVGRSLVIWANNHRELARAIASRGLRCTFVIADPQSKGLKSMAPRDYAMNDLQACWKTFREFLVPDINQNASSQTGSFAVFGIPTYTPVTFASYTGPNDLKFCIIEVGIGVGPVERPSLYFKNVSDCDMYTALNKVFRGVIEGRQPLVVAPDRGIATTNSAKT